MVVESQHTHARMVHGSRCMRDAHVLSALNTVGDSCVLKRAKHHRTISRLIHDILLI